MNLIMEEKNKNIMNKEQSSNIIEKNMYNYAVYEQDENKKPRTFNETIIRFYGLDENCDTVCVIIKDFTPYVYIELPEIILWDNRKLNLLRNHLFELMSKKYKGENEYYPIKTCLIYKKKLYGINLVKKTGENNEDSNKENTESPLVKKTFPYLFMSFKSKVSIMKFKNEIIRYTIYVPYVGRLNLAMHEYNSSAILQLLCYRDISAAGWMKAKGLSITDENKKETRCKYELNCSWKNLHKHTDNEGNDIDPPNPLVCSFDIEVNSSIPTSMPKNFRPFDIVFQISCILGNSRGVFKKYLLTLGKPNLKSLVNIEVLHFKDEYSLLAGFSKFILEKNPIVIIGYNIFGFDIDYMLKRSEGGCGSICTEFSDQGLHKKLAQQRTIKWTSSAFKDQFFQFLDAEGRLFIDLLPIVRRDYKLSNYRLSTVSQHFLKQSKDPLKPKGIFKCFRIGCGYKFSENSLVKKEIKNMDKAARMLSLCGKYCVEDSILVYNLFFLLNVWFGITSMANVCNIKPIDVFTRGQQIKLYSLVYKKCMKDNTVVESDAYKAGADERYTGAIVFDPIPGLHENVIPLDFCLTGDTMITLSDGSKKRIDNINGNEKVLGFDIEKERFKSYRIIGGLQYKGDRSVIEIKFSMGNSIICTPEHKFLVRNFNYIESEISKFEWIKAKDLLGKNVVEGSVYCKKYRKFTNILKYSKKYMIFSILKVIEIKDKGIHPVYDIEVEKVHNFLANDVVVHNCSLYPTTIIANNLSWDSWVKDDSDIPNNLCSVCEWEDHKGCSHDTTKRTVKLKKEDVMCAKRYYRFIKSSVILGIMPQVLTDLIEGRNEAKRQLAKAKKELAEAKILLKEVEIENVKNNIKETSDKMAKILDLIKVLELRVIVYDKKQESMKLACNSAYGCSGASVGALSHPPIAMCTTFKAREAITKTSEYIPKVHNAVLVYGDSVVGDTPLMIRNIDTKIVSIIRIDKINSVNDINNINNTNPNYNWESYDQFKAGESNRKDKQQCIIHNTEIYTNNGWKKIIRVIRHKTVKKIYRINTGKGCIDVTEDHSLLLENGEKIKPIDTKIGTKLLHNFPNLNLDQESRDKLSIWNIMAFNTKESCQDAYCVFKSKGLNTSISYVRNFDASTQKYVNEYRLEVKGGIDTEEGKIDNSIKTIEDLGYSSDYVYDIETEDGTFHAGIGELIIKNTDSNYVKFNGLTDSKEIWDKAIEVAKDVSKLFPPPMSLAFENKIYRKFLILTKKRYMWHESGRDGIIKESNGKPELGKKGVLLARRDNAKIIRTIYTNSVEKIIDMMPEDEVIYHFYKDIINMISGYYPCIDFVITKSVGEIKDYKIRALSDDPKKREKRLKDLNCTEEEYAEKALPSQAILFNKMKARGENIAAGVRLEYVIIDVDNPKAKVKDKIEDYKYYFEHRRILKLDYLYYITLLSNPIEQLFQTMYGEKYNKFSNYIVKLFKVGINTRKRIVRHMDKHFSRVKIVVEDDE